MPGWALTLEATTDGLGVLPPTGAAGLILPLRRPVAGCFLRQAGEADAAGIARPGLVTAAEAGAPVTAPAPAPGTLCVAGPLLHYGNVIIMEPVPELLAVFAGLVEDYAEP